MKILYAIQGTGNGHISRAKAFMPHLVKVGDLDLLVSGTSSEVDVGYQVKYKHSGLSFKFGTKGGIDYKYSLLSSDPISLINDIMTIDLSSYNLVISDFEPIVSWACKRLGKNCVGLSHQAAFLSSNTPRISKKNHLQEWILRYYAPVTEAIGFHYQRYDSFIYPPVIRPDVRSLKPYVGDHVTVYLPSYADSTLINIFRRVGSVEWEVFSKHCSESYSIENISVYPITNEAYLRSLEGCCGLISGAGFEAPSEAIHLGKKLMSIPMSGQYEQQCNAAALKKLGVYVVERIDEFFIEKLKYWLKIEASFVEQYDDYTEEIVWELKKSVAHQEKPMNSLMSY